METEDPVAFDTPRQFKQLWAAHLTTEMIAAIEDCHAAERAYVQAEQAHMSYNPKPDFDNPVQLRANANHADHLRKERNKAKRELYAARRTLGLIAVKWALQEGVIEDVS